MQTDEERIRCLIADWQSASKAGDLDRILSLMADDVVFLVPGQQPFGKEAFAAGFQMLQNFRIEAASDIQEIHVAGDWAYCWNRLSVTMTPIKDGSPSRRSGHTLTIFRKNKDGAWVLARDANMVMPA